MGRRIVALDKGEAIEEREHRGEGTCVSAAAVLEKPGQLLKLYESKESAILAW
jgi:hypothetical protein